MRRWATWLLVATLAGCAATPLAPSPPAPASVTQFVAWTAAGRLAMAAGDEGGSGSFTWRQDGTTTTLSIRGPLGAGAIEIFTDGQSLSVTDGTGRSVDTTRAEEALRSRLGADLPWTQLRYWMLGVPAPGEASTVVDSRVAPVRVIDQAGWNVGYESFRPVAGTALPSRFSAARGTVRLKVVVDDWTIEPEAPGAP